MNASRRLWLASEPIIYPFPEPRFTSRPSIGRLPRHRSFSSTKLAAATNRDPEREVQRGNFREDLYWRLNVVPIVLPPLRERQEDILLLASHYLKKFKRDYGQSVHLADETLSVLSQYHGPGKVRELANTIERFVSMAEKDMVGFKELPANIAGRETIAVPVQGPVIGNGGSLSQEVSELEKKRIIKALRANTFVQNRASLSLGITPPPARLSHQEVPDRSA